MPINKKEKKKNFQIYSCNHWFPNLEISDCMPDGFSSGKYGWINPIYT